MCITPSPFKWIVPATGIASVLAPFLILSVCAFADTLVISQDGSWGVGPNCPATYCTTPGDSWQWSLQIDSNPVPSNFTLAADFEAGISNFEFSDNGAVIPSLTGSQAEITFFSVLQCGGLSTDDQTTIDECADNQFYSGDESAPTLVPGTYSPELIPEVGGCGDTPGGPCSDVTFGDITIAVVPTPTPEPSSVVIVIVPLLVIAFLIRNRRVHGLTQSRS
jgi:hypothetical protein